MHVGAIIHKIRKDRKMTLAELSKQSGVALATLSRMENGRMTGTLESHMKICETLEMKLPDLYKDLYPARKAVELHAKKSAADVFFRGKNVSSEMLASKVSGKKMMPVLIKLSKGGVTHKEEAKVGCEKFVYVLSGKIEIIIGEETYNLTSGDTLYFDSSVPHFFKNMGGVESRFITVTCPPTL